MILLLWQCDDLAAYVMTQRNNTTTLKYMIEYTTRSTTVLKNISYFTLEEWFLSSILMAGNRCAGWP